MKSLLECTFDPMIHFTLLFLGLMVISTLRAIRHGLYGLRNLKWAHDTSVILLAPSAGANHNIARRKAVIFDNVPQSCAFSALELVLCPPVSGH